MRVALAALLLVACVSGPQPRGTGIDQQPMYGGMDRQAVPILKAGDEDFIAGVTAAWGSREAGSHAGVDQGFRYYQQDDLSTAMKRFNQAWLLNPDNPDSYWGFASVLHDEHRFCEAKAMFDHALERNLSDPSAFADAGLVFTECALSDASLSPEAKAALLARADELFAKAEASLPNNPYVLDLWARSYCYREDVARCPAMVARAQAAGAVFPAPFLAQVRELGAKPAP